MKQRGKRITALVLALALLLSACGGKKENAAATMYLVRTEGTVQVGNAEGKTIKLMENLGLFSGYAVATQAESYGWIDMDTTRLAKLDAGSEVEIRKEDQLLELNVRSGNLFFNVTEPLKPEETMNVRTSTMMVGIRGTCGWVEVEDENLMRAYLLRGKVDCGILDGNGGILMQKTITAGQSAIMRLENGSPSITTAEFDTSRLPAFVAAENPESGTGDMAEADSAGDESSGSGNSNLADADSAGNGNSGSGSGDSASADSARNESSSSGNSNSAGEARDESGPLADYAGTYTVYPNYVDTLEGRYGSTLTLHGDGSVDGAGVDGQSPARIIPSDDGKMTISYSNPKYTTYMSIVIYPPGTGRMDLAGADAGRVNLQLARGGDDRKGATTFYYADSSAPAGAR